MDTANKAQRWKLSLNSVDVDIVTFFSNARLGRRARELGRRLTLTA